MGACEVCTSQSEPTTGKYKCPICFIKYCSVACWNEHKQTNCAKETPKDETFQVDDSAATQYLFPTDDTVPPVLLEQLGQSEKIRSLLRNPLLQKIILEVDKRSKVKSLIEEAMLEPIFAEFADACLEIVEPSMSDDYEVQ